MDEQFTVLCALPSDTKFPEGARMCLSSVFFTASSSLMLSMSRIDTIFIGQMDALMDGYNWGDLGKTHLSKDTHRILIEDNNNNN